MAADLHGTPAMRALLPTAPLAGYGAGVALIAFVPGIALRLSLPQHLCLLAAALLAAGAAPDLAVAAAAGFVAGIGAAASQRVLASAARRAGPARAGTAIGATVCAALLAVLLVRLAGDTLAAIIGWRNVFFAAAGWVGVSAAAVAALEHASGATPPTAGLEMADADGETIGLTALWRQAAVFRRATLQQAALFAAYNAAWMTVLMDVPAAQRAPVVILGGGAGVAAALAGGRIVDGLGRRDLGRRDLARTGAAAILLAACVLLPAAYGVAGNSATWRVLCLVPGMALVDAGLQLALVANQTRVQALLPAARSRLAAALTVCGAGGGALGAGASYWLWQHAGWPPAIALVAIAGALGLACSARPAQRVRFSEAPGRSTGLHASSPMLLREKPRTA